MNSVFHDNIIIGSAGFIFGNTDVNNNICSVDLDVVGNGNQSNVDMSTVFDETGSDDGKWKVKDSFTNTNKSSDGTTEFGAFGGTTPYVLSGIPDIPHITFFSGPGSATQGSGLKVHLKATTER